MTKPESSLGIEGAVSQSQPVIGSVPLPTREAEEPAALLKPGDVEWIVNDTAELGVKIGQQFFFCYKGGSLVYEDPHHEHGSPMHWRPVFKREFGECVHPVNRTNPLLIGTVSLDDSDEWQLLPGQPSEASPLGAEPDATGIVQGRDEQITQPSHDDEGLIERLNGEADLIDVGMNMDDGDTIEVLRQAANTISRLKGELENAEVAAVLWAVSDLAVDPDAHDIASLRGRFAEARALLSPRLVGVEGDEVIPGSSDARSSTRPEGQHSAGGGEP